MRTSESIIETDPLPPALTQFVRRFVLRSRRLDVVQAVGTVLAFTLIWTLAWSLFDRLLPTPRWFRVMLLVIDAAAAVTVLAPPIRRLFSAGLPWHRAAAAIEAVDPRFGGGLQTALSQLLMPVDQRGSASLLAQVVEQSAASAMSLDPRTLLPSKNVLRPAAIAASALVLMLLLLASAWLDLPRLLKRGWLPFLNAAPVTTTRLLVAPGSVDVIEGDPLKITVRAERLGDSQPLLQWRDDDPVFSSAVMLPEPGGFSYTFSSIDRPVAYRVVGGDATSALFDVHVTARPSVHELRVSYAYPAWAELPPKPSTIFNGDLEGPTGTIATVSITGNQALSGARCVVDGKIIESAASVDPAVRRLAILLQTSAPWHIELTNPTGITGAGPSGMTIRAVSPQRPQANLRLPSDEDELRLHPRDVLSLAYEASDLFALARVSAEIAVNSKPPVTIAIPLGTNHRSQIGSFDVDLAQLSVKLGDVVTITLIDENKAGLSGMSSACRIVVSPQSIDLNAEQRLRALREAARLATLLSDETSAAQKGLEQSPPGDAKEARDEQISPHLAVGDGIAAAMSTQLLRAIAHSNRPELSNALAWLADDTVRSASGLEAVDAVILTEMRDPLRNRLNGLSGLTDELQRSLDVLWRGEFAAQILAEAADAAADEARLASLAGAQANAVRRSAQRARHDEITGCTLLGIDSHAVDVEMQLQRRVDQSSDLAKRFGPVDFASAANEWSTTQPEHSTGLVGRMTIASEAEAVGPEGDFIWARDLQLSARAARRIDTADDLPANIRQEYPRALRVLQDLHALVVAHTQAGQLAEPMKAAGDARRRMRLWAGETDLSATNPSTMDQERAALEAAAAETEQKIEDDARLEQATGMGKDSALPPDLSTSPNASTEPFASPAAVEELKHAAVAARKLERLTAEQRILRIQTAGASDFDLHELAGRQAALTDAIENARAEKPRLDLTPSAQAQENSPKDSRESAMNAIRSAQERLMGVPKEIERARQAQVKEHNANLTADKAQQDADLADIDSKDTSQQTADEAQGAADAAKAQATAAQVSPDEASNVAASLREFVPETTPAVDTIDQQLTPELATMRQTQSTDDDNGNQRAAQRATQAVAEAQRRLNDGLQGLLNRDALTTAKFFSSNAAQQLASPEPDRAAAVRLQRGASAALEQAWDEVLHKAAGQRLAHLPSMAAILQLYPGEGSMGGESAQGTEPAPAEREWGRLRQRSSEDLSAGSREIDTPEYQDAIRAYFRDLAREDAGEKR